MSSYIELSQVYDAFMREGPHQDWMDFITEHVPNLELLKIADIGCGTGKLTVSLAPHCLSIVGVDLSEEMLTKAQERAFVERVNATWLQQDMTQLRLPFLVDGVVSSCDSLNYLASLEDLQEVFRCVYAQLRPSGWFYFDMLGPERIESLREGFWYDLQPEAAILYETSVVDQHLITYDVNAFVQEQGGLYRRFDEHHEQRYFRAEEVKSTLETCGFHCEDILGDFGRNALGQADRMVFVTRRKD